jgi:hypothetical protein
MGRELIDRYEVFRHSLADAGSYLKELGCAWDLLGIVYDLSHQSWKNVADPFGQTSYTNQCLTLTLMTLHSASRYARHFNSLWSIY